MVQPIENYPHDIESDAFKRWLNRLTALANTSRGGWAEYEDGRYVDSDALPVLANTRTQLTNDGSAASETRWAGGHTFYDTDTSTIVGSLGHLYLLDIHLALTPQSPAASHVDLWFELANSGLRISETHIDFAKGTGADNRITYSTLLPFKEQAAAQGMQIYLQCPGPVDLFDIKFEFALLYDADQLG